MGNIYVAGVTRSEDFPTTKGSYDETSNGGDDIFVTKLAPNGRTLVYSTFLGGSNYESFGGMAIDSGGKVYVTGSTSSSDYPVTEGCYDGSHGDYNEILVTKLSPSGSSLHYSTFVGGEGTEYGGGIALDSENNAWVTGTTTSEDFPTTEGCLDDSFGKFDDVVVFKLNLTAEEKKEEDDSGGFLPGFEIVAVSLSIAVVAFVRKRKH